MIAAFLDLDRTLIHSARSVAEETARLEVVEYIDGVASAYAAPGLAGELMRLACLASVVPTTTRSVEQLRRVTLFKQVPVRFEIAANGGVILERGRIDPHWSRTVADSIRSGRRTVEWVLEHAVAAEPTSVARIVDDVFVYLVLPTADRAESARLGLDRLCRDAGWGCSRQGRKVYLVPDVVEKAVAMAEVARRLGASTVLAAGDAELDRRMLAAADHPIVPAHADVRRPPGVAVTPSAGPGASLEIVRWMYAQADRSISEPGTKETVWTSAAG
ncbi:HAD family hydrolase [Microbacteriaceae bacterium VKM Ac-2855]|nr:HAD family hydrolase [Microbacteriaceae bacterium VKM Ac-2855]